MSESSPKPDPKLSETEGNERMRSDIILRSAESTGQIIRQAESDEQLIQLWLHGRSQHTQRAYMRDAQRFMESVSMPLQSVKLIDLQTFGDHLAQTLKAASVNRTLSAVKSLFAFGFQLGYFRFDVGRALKLPGFRDQLAERIIGEAEVLRIISLEPNLRNRSILMTLYAGGFRVSEICSLKWMHLQQRDSVGQITVFGKGDKTRTVLMPQTVWDMLMRLKGDVPANAPVFYSRKAGHLSQSAVWRVVKQATKRAGIDKDVSCHWFRHAHASHALDRGCPIHLVQATLGHSSIATTGRYLHARPTESSGEFLPV